MAIPLFSYELTLPDFQIQDASSIQSATAQLNNALRVPHVRLLSYVMPIVPERFESVRRKHMSMVQTELGRLYLEEEARSLRAFLETEPSWNMRHYLLAWEQPVRAIGDWLRPAAPPEPLGKISYVEDLDYLRPTDRSGKYVKIIGTYEFRPGTWTHLEPWASLITQADGPMILALDAIRLPSTSVRLARRGLKNTIQASKDDEEELQELADIAQESLMAREDFYKMRLFIMFRDARPDRLLERAARFRQMFETSLAFSLLRGRQAAALRFFTEARRPAMPTDSHHTILATALPVAFGGLGGMTSYTKPEGIYLGQRLGIGAKSLGPVYLNLWTATNRAAHIGFLGITGSGKSVSMMAMLARERANGIAVCLIEPMGNAGKIAHLLARDPGMHLHKLTWQTVCINPLDYVGETAAEQANHMHALFQTMLDRRLDNIERGLIDKALSKVYAGMDQDIREDPANSPLLADFCQTLTEIHDPQADYLARELESMYVSGGYGSIFNRRTNLDLRFDGATLFDVQEVAGPETTNERFKTILYYTLFASLIRTARRDKQAGLVQRRILAVDEYYALARNPYLKERMDILIKTARNLKLGIWFAEQNLATFCGVKMGDSATNDMASGSGYFMLTNVDRWFTFKQSDAEAKLLHREFTSRCPQAFSEFLPAARVGQCVALLESSPIRTYVLDFNLLPSEIEALTR